MLVDTSMFLPKKTKTELQVAINDHITEVLTFRNQLSFVYRLGLATYGDSSKLVIPLSDDINTFMWNMAVSYLFITRDRVSNLVDGLMIVSDEIRRVQAYDAPESKSIVFIIGAIPPSYYYVNYANWLNFESTSFQRMLVYRFNKSNGRSPNSVIARKHFWGIDTELHILKENPVRCITENICTFHHSDIFKQPNAHIVDIS
ncbi:hypothetical protein GJ496_005506 [Pomphorhynchus laevis]|nr:hypothetical protein GJ496_005506 [Pomphorhynchus laevis]